jgi:hypothetical protein
MVMMVMRFMTEYTRGAGGQSCVDLLASAASDQINGMFGHTTEE